MTRKKSGRKKGAPVMPVRVLIVDDTDHVREMLASMLDLDGFDVVGRAAGGEEAVRVAQATIPHVVIMDYKMPGMDGITATERLREVMPGLPVILYTAYLDAVLEERARKAGVSLCVGKVEGLETLERQISALCLELMESEKT
jgi:two-component system, response regulator PdtaR